MIVDTLKFIYNHPFNRHNKLGGVVRFLKWQINCRLNPYPVVYPYTENAKLMVWKGLTGATGNVYCGLMEFADMAFLLHFLRKDDYFIDIGSNVGAYTMLASAEIGAKTVAIEPIPSTFESLLQNIGINQIHDLVSALNVGVGATKGSIRFTQSLDTVNHVATDEEQDTIEVEVVTLDSVVAGKMPSLIKIDVEGFETDVIRGAESTLQADSLKAIIIELNGLGERYNYDEGLVHQKLLSLGFEPYDYTPNGRRLTPLETYGSHNTIYLRDLPFVRERIESSRAIKVGRPPQAV